jgi:Protein of unknown function (DUF2752)
VPARENDRVDDFAAPVTSATRPRLVRRLLPPLGSLAGVVGAFAYVGAVDPNEPGHYPVCPLYRLTGVYCPACGGLRTAYAVAHGEWARALGENVLVVALFAAYAAFTALWLLRATRGIPLRLHLRPTHAYLLTTAATLFTVLRNLPFGAALAP